MRLWALAIAGALVASCGESASTTEDGNAAAGEVTVSLPPALPVETPKSIAPAAPEPAAQPTPVPPVELPLAIPKAQPKTSPPAAEKAAPLPEAPAEPDEPEAEPPAQPAAEPDALPEASPPIAAEGLARYIRGAGFECDRVVATRRAPGSGPYRFDCAAGGSYRGTMRRGRLYFRPWSDLR